MSRITILVFSLLVLGLEARGAEIVAFHGINQSVRSDANPGQNDCTAPLVNFENHRFIENTLISLDVAFYLGADIGHFNIRRTADKQLVAFHDDDLSCRTDGTGSVRQTNLDKLKLLDIGYGYSPYGCTVDNAKTCCQNKLESDCFPTRGLGKGLMPTLSEILDRFPNRQLAINDKDGGSETIDLLRLELSKYKSARIAKLIYIGNAVDLVRKKIPAMQVVSSQAETIQCFKDPTDPGCQNKLFALPMSYVPGIKPKLSKILAALHASGSKVMVFDVNSKADVDSIQGLSFDMIGTYRIDQTIQFLK